MSKQYDNFKSLLRVLVPDIWFPDTGFTFHANDRRLKCRGLPLFTTIVQGAIGTGRLCCRLIIVEEVQIFWSTIIEARCPGQSRCLGHRLILSCLTCRKFELFQRHPSRSGS